MPNVLVSDTIPHVTQNKYIYIRLECVLCLYKCNIYEDIIDKITNYHLLSLSAIVVSKIFTFTNMVAFL